MIEKIQLIKLSALLAALLLGITLPHNIAEAQPVTSIVTGHRIPSIEVENLNYAVFPKMAIGQSLVAVAFDEAGQGPVGTDFNGDLDTNDQAFHVLDIETDTITNFNAAVSTDCESYVDFIQADGEVAAVLFDEVNQFGLDFNGDGDVDVNDKYVIYYDKTTGAYTSPVFKAVRNFTLKGRTIAYALSEAQNDGTDFSGDGDSNDDLLHVYNVDTHSDADLQLALGSHEILIEDNLVVFGVGEAHHQGGTDLNGDGDFIDTVLHVFDTQQPEGPANPLNLGYVTSLDYFPYPLHAQVQGNLVAFHVIELYHWADLNLDGDFNDNVAFIYDASLPVGPTNPKNLGYAAHTIQLHGDKLAFTVPEKNQGDVDMNGDGDTADYLLHLYDHETGNIKGFDKNLYLGNYRLGEKALAFSISEYQDNYDHNGDGDTLDYVFHIYDINQKFMFNTKLGIGPGSDQIQVDGNTIAFRVDESDSDMTDLNGDGDYYDLVPHTINQSGKITNLELAAMSFELNGNQLTFEMSENNQGAIDVNGDGDHYDLILHVYDVASGQMHNTGLALGFEEPSFFVGDGIVTFPVSEKFHSADLNDDLDSLDAVGHTFTAQ